MREIDFAEEREQLVLDASIFVGSASSSARVSVERELEVGSGSGSVVEAAQSQCSSSPPLVSYGPDAGLSGTWGERYSIPHLPVPEARWVDFSEISQGNSSQSVSTSQSDYATSSYSSLSDWDKMQGPVTRLPSAALNIASDSKCSCCTSRASKKPRTLSSPIPTRSRGQVKSRPSPMAAVPSAARPGYGSRRGRAHQRVIPVPQAVVGCTY
uniref:Uncharacterized protein n=1 Tax=Mycena chlorophos TaxID=658473 RepID=A0ABQ0LDV3_MYCCL|nr:predicted protein [Mycena chlorophos]